MSGKLEGKVAIITGAGRGIGRSIAMAMAAEGAKIVVADIGKDAEDKPTADSTVELINKKHGSAVPSYEDISKMEGGEKLVATALDNFGRVDIVVNCAGFAKVAQIVETREEDWDGMVAVHLKGHFSVTVAAVKQMIKQGQGGRLINFSSRAPFVSQYIPGMTHIAYSTVKAGIVGFTNLCALELKQYGITANAILPSAVTPGFPEKRPRFGGGDTPGPEYVAPVVVYLATDEAKDITGQYIYASAGDIAVLSPPLRLEGPNKFAFKNGMWTIEEISKVLPSMVY